MADTADYRRVIRVHVSYTPDAAAERTVLEEVVSSLNREEGDPHGVHVELYDWKRDTIPRLGPDTQAVVREQSPRCDIYLGILSASFGDGPMKSEFEAALNRYQNTGEPWILYYFNEDARPGWEPDDVDRFKEVSEFRKKLQNRAVIGKYKGARGSANGFYEQVSRHLRNLIHRLAPPSPHEIPPTPPSDPTKYLRDVLEKSGWIDIRGLQIGTGRTNRFPIEELYISLTTTSPSTADELRKKRAGIDHRDLLLPEHRDELLQKALRHDRLVVIGDPGAGKTTFLRRIAYALCQTQLGDVPKAAEERLGLRDRTFPIYVRVSQLAYHLQTQGNSAAAPAGESAAWLPHFLGSDCMSNGGGLEAGFFQRHLENGRCTVLLDGLDEAPERILRERVSRLIRQCTTAYDKCRFVVTSRPAAYSGEVVLPGFEPARIDPLSDPAVETFVSRWCDAVYPDSQADARAHREELLAAIRGRSEIRRMASNPVMLTALAVVHWNERRLPEQRADLYESIITWLSRSREQRPGREKADRTIVLLQELALAMQEGTEGRKTQVPKRWAAEKLAGEFGDGQVTREAIAKAERFLDEDEIDSGIVVGRGNEVAFWHLTFQEFLAAKAIASRLDGEQQRLLFTDPERVYLPDWREVILLLAGTLHEQGRPKVDGLIANMLGALGALPPLANQARCAGLIGAILRDLDPLKYHVVDSRYLGLLDAVMAIFDRDRCQGVSVEERIAAADALGQSGDPRLDIRRDDHWVDIPAGTFRMGAQSTNKRQPNYDTEANDDESPVHEVLLAGFRIARYPTTVGQYKQFLDDDGYGELRWWTAGGFGEFSEPEDWGRQMEYPSRPVVGVCWWEANAYSAWAGCRLLTEAEWERAARGTEGRKYPWGSQQPDVARANYDRNVGHPTPVGIYPQGATAEGLIDMAGNVWEWCHDVYADYNVAAVRDPSGAAEATDRVIRGGSWRYGARYCRAAFRNAYHPGYRDGDLGFRVAAVPHSKSSQEPGTEAGA